MLYTYESQVLVGTILGGSSLVKPPKGKNYYLSMRSKNAIWLKYKMQLMPSYFPVQTVHKYGITHRCNSRCCPELSELYKVMYKDGDRAISMPILDSLKDIALAIWFLDGGSRTGRDKKNAYINTTKFGTAGTDTICQYFNEVDLDCNINHDGDRLKILFTVAGTRKFLRVVAHHFPKFMEDRLD